MFPQVYLMGLSWRQSGPQRHLPHQRTSSSLVQQQMAAPAPGGTPSGIGGSRRSWWMPWWPAAALPRERSGLLGRFVGPYLAPAPAPAAAAVSHPRVGDTTASGGPRHLVLLVNGLFGSAANWDVTVEQLRTHLDSQDTLLYASTANARFATYDGIDACGSRLADEVRGLVAETPSLRRISIVAHSMGGLMARYAIGLLFNPQSSTIAGLVPGHFVTLATPHCGCDAEGVAQVPFIGWTSALPLLGGALQGLLRDVSGPAAALLFRRTGEQFFLLDGQQHQQDRVDATNIDDLPAAVSGSASDATLPVLLQMSQDCPERGLFFYSALAAFRSRTAYANTDGDHLVGFANSSLRSLGGLPPLPPAAARAKGVVLEDPVSAAFFPGTWAGLQRSWQSQQRHAQGGQQAQQSSGSPRRDQQLEGQQAICSGVFADAAGDAVSAPYQPSRQWEPGSPTSSGPSSSGRSSSGPSPPDGAAVAGLPAWHELQQSLSARSSALAQWGLAASQRSQRQGLSSLAALEHNGAPAGAAGGALNQRAASGSSSAADSGDDVLLELVEPPPPLAPRAPRHQQPGGTTATAAAARSASARTAGGMEAAAAAEQDLAAGLSGAATPAAASASDAVEAVAADVEQLAAAQPDGRGRPQHVAHMLRRLQELPWRRIDVSFQGARFGFAHNNIQVTRRWLNFEGVAVPRHLAQQLQLMETLLVAEDPYGTGKHAGGVTAPNDQQ